MRRSQVRRRMVRSETREWRGWEEPEPAVEVPERMPQQPGQVESSSTFRYFTGFDIASLSQESPKPPSGPRVEKAFVH